MRRFAKTLASRPYLRRMKTCFESELTKQDLILQLETSNTAVPAGFRNSGGVLRRHVAINIIRDIKASFVRSHISLSPVFVSYHVLYDGCMLLSATDTARVVGTLDGINRAYPASFRTDARQVLGHKNDSVTK